LIRAKPYKTVVIIGPSHHKLFRGFSVYASGAFFTPLGKLDVDESFAGKLIAQSDLAVFNADAFNQEHSVEVELPFLQSALKDFKIVPVVYSDVTFDDCKEFASLLNRVIGLRQDVLIVVSTDMYHGYSLKEAEDIDGLTLAALKRMDAEALYYGLRDGVFQMCGGFGAVTGLILAKQAGYNNFELLSNTNSAQETGNYKDGNWLVGYAAGVFYRKEDRLMLNDSEKKRLLEIARSSIESFLKTSKPPDVKADQPNLLRSGGAFVTLHEDGMLRGCIGNIVTDTALYITVRDMAIASATNDPRFRRLKPEELKKVKIEISALSPLEKVNSADNIELGKHGVLVKKGFRSGVFLPQVAVETGWSKEEFLTNLCVEKAGLAPDAWKDKDTDIYIFSAQVFSE
ncbi:MAG: AmmeMemoRadiSam system protein A, partial [Candidatus Omnitrophica bacterium]|nr:AmmeMemoRadiSam system protein A [Candidatus Omnitrophota bacterium]